MTKTNYLLCPGDNCPLKMSCYRYFAWFHNEDDEAPEMEPDYHEGKCYGFEPKRYYGG